MPSHCVHVLPRLIKRQFLLRTFDKLATIFTTFSLQVLDYTIIGCDADTIENRFCIDPIEFTEEDPLSIGDDIFIFQHPKGDTKKFSYQKISRIERPYVYYNADTDIGSSGSVVLRKFKLIAVHSKGSDLLQYNKGTLCSEILHHLRTGTCKLIVFCVQDILPSWKFCSLPSFGLLKLSFFPHLPPSSMNI